MDQNDVQRYTGMFNNALVYTVAGQILTHIIQTGNISVLPVVITTVLGITTMIFQMTAHIRQKKLEAVGGLWWDSFDLLETILKYATEVLVQFLGQAASRLVMHSFSDSTDDEATATGVIIGIILLYALTRAANRPVTRRQKII